ncbi:MAG: RNA polymerase sigma factor [Bacteroidales bacterium]|nr:RNA polymerase sigma factor [Bacteroidales bacterium]
MTVNEYNKAVNKFSDNVYRFILKNIKNEMRAQDIVQDSFEKLWINRKAVIFEKTKSYLFTTAYRTMIDYIRKEKKVNLTDNNAVFESIHEDNYSDIQEVLHEAVSNLPEIQRSVILLRDYEGYSYKDIADITNLNESQVKVYIYRARVYLKNYIGKIENVV